MAPRLPQRMVLALAPAALFLTILLVSVPAFAMAPDPFPGYPAAVREKALRVVQEAAPVPAEPFAREVRSLRKAMFDHGILSLNALPDLVFERSVREGWKRQAYVALRETTRVAPLSVPLWAWLVREDLVRLEPERLISDAEGLAGAVGAFAPALPGHLAWLLLVGSAAACWYAAWASLALLLRGRTALAADVSRLFRSFPHPEVPGALIAWCAFVGPAAAGAGIGVCAVVWIALSAGYVRRGELVMAVTAILLLGGVYLSASALDSLGRLAGATRTGAWLGGEGYLARAWPDVAAPGETPVFAPDWEAMVRFGRARAEMQAGDLQASERLWSELIRDGLETAGSYNNRGIVRARLGKTGDALLDFEAAVERTPWGGPAHWNAYQLYLGTFRLDQAARIQSAAWGSIGKMPPFDFRAEEMTRGELVPSPLPAGEVWGGLLAVREGERPEEGANRFQALAFRVLPGGWIPAFLAAGCLWAVSWSLLSRRVWLHCACRSCGALTMVARTKETSDVCNSCRAQVGGGVRGGDERERRLMTIRLHRRYVRACSLLVPGSGALWAGKELRAMAFGFALCAPLGVLTVALGAGAASGGLISDLQALFAGIAAVCAALAWAAGAWWGWRSFELLQLRYNVAGEGS